jgi:hypothetical protein
VSSLTHGWSGLMLAYAAVEVPLAATLIHDLGVSSGRFLEFAVGVGMSAGIGYAAARGLARPAKPLSVHQRGTVGLCHG